jgi:2-polyprenyl-6-methoxyphenol hydroxylase-like FAD-dependent oxidoreductase
MRVGIVGAGLADLATAAAFRRSGHEVSVYEQAAAGPADHLVRRAAETPARRQAAQRHQSGRARVMQARLVALSGGPVLRRITRPADGGGPCQC